MHSLDVITNGLTTPIEAAGYTVRRGWNDDIASELTELSVQSHIIAMTPKDSLHRFSTSEAAHEWYHDHERTIYTLGRNAVAGLIWFGKTENSPYGDYTFAIRMYEEVQGQHLARPFMHAAHADFFSNTHDASTIWLDTHIDNDRAIALYEKVGYKTLHQVNDRLVMVYAREQMEP